ncbi:MAG: PAS domain-containing protein [Krumholzibacteria bacterium]|nr:PAS domain-containing protein [Candidatus Krumholzibacteria bacterium]
MLRTAAAAGPASPRLVIAHQDAFAGDAGGDRLVSWLEDLAALPGTALPILLHGRLPAPQLVSFFRAGLFDALAVPVDQLDWVNMLIRAERRLELRQQGRRALSEAGRTQGQLRRLRRSLGEETVRSADDLLKAHETLAAANRQLTDAMAELSLLYRFGRQLSSARNWDAVLREILRNLGEFVGAGGAALILRAAPGGPCAPRQTWHWDERSWDRVLVDLQDQVDTAVAERIMAPGVFRIDPAGEGGAAGSRRIIALPLEHQELGLGFLLLLFADPPARAAAAERYLPFLQAVQVVLSEEVAGAQMLDRIRDIGAFNARVLETVRSAIWVLDETGRTVFANRAAREMLTGRPAGGEAGDDFLLTIGRGRRVEPLAEEEGLPELLLDARLDLDDHTGPLPAFLRRRPEGVHRGEGHIAGDDGGRIPVLVQTSLMPGRSRDEHWLVVVAEDLRDTRILEAERLRADRLEGLVEMSATLAHEIRNPLMGLSAQAELLAEHLHADDDRRRYLDVITREVGRIDDTITRMLNFVRPYAPALGPVDLGALVRDALDLARPRAAARGVRLELEGPASGAGRGAGLVADGGQLQQVLLNLIINGVDAAPEGGRLRVVLRDGGQVALADPVRGTRRRVPGLVVEVRDDGPGVAPADLPRIFRPFYTTKSSGTGLGLAISHKIVTAHGGEIAVERDGGETVFRVVLPRRAADDGPHQREEAS